MSEKLTPENSFWGWKALIITVIISAFFMGFLYLAVTSEPDYMPSHKYKENLQNSQQSSSETAPQHSEHSEHHSH